MEHKMLQPSQYVTEVDELELPDGTLTAGEWVTYSTSVYDVKTNQSYDIRETGRVTSLFVENHPNVGRERTYFEVECRDGGSRRVWTWRDAPRHADALEPELGPAPDDAMF